MNLFYHPNPNSVPFLDPEESHHCIKVMRMQVGDKIHIIDGRGGRFDAVIKEAAHKKCQFTIISSEQTNKTKGYHIHIVIAPTKNQDRIEWFVEKVCELGIDEVTLVQTQRTERKHINLARLEKKSIGAMKQSKNLYKTKINPMTKFAEVITSLKDASQKFIAFVDVENTLQLTTLIKPQGHYIMCIGPEGDFTKDEVELAINSGFHQVSLGRNVLRTETAGVIAAHTFQVVNELNLS